MVMAIDTILAQIDEEIARLTQVRSLLAGSGSSASGLSGRKAKKAPAKAKKSRVLSPEARKRIADAQRKRWAAHLVSAGFAEAEAFYHLQSWRKEDTYFGIETELELLRNAGFTDLDVAWRYGPMAVTVGKKPS